MTATHSFFPRPLIFKLQQEVLKLSDTWVSWNFSESYLEAKLLDLEN